MMRAAGRSHSVPGWSTSIVLWLGLLLLITAARWEIVDSPPYYDFAIGIFPEADYLAKSNFDYLGLRYSESHSLDYDGGRRSYMTSMMPTLLAVAMRVLPSVPATLVAYHLFTFACAALLAMTMIWILAPRFGLGSAILTTLTALATPVLCTQIDMTGMEIPLAAAVMLCAYFVDREQPIWAAFAALVAFFIKPTGLLATATLLVVLGLQLGLGSRDRDRRRKRSGGFLFALGTLGLELAVLWWSRDVNQQFRQGPNLLPSLVWCPDVVLLLLAVTMIGLIVLVAGRTWRKERWSARRLGEAVGRSVEESGLYLFAGLLLCALVLAATQVVFIPRYVALMVPLLYLFVARIVLASARFRWAGNGVLAAILAVHLVNWNGDLFPPLVAGLRGQWGSLADDMAREGSFLERSHEYLADHRANLDAMKQLEREAGPDPVVLAMPHCYFAAFPELGYVTRPLEGYCVNGFTNCSSRFAPAEQLLEDRPAHPVFLRVPNIFQTRFARFEIPEPTTKDTVMFTDGAAHPLVVYRKGWEAEPPSEKVLERWYARHAWPDDTYVPRLVRLLDQGDQPAAIEHMRGVVANRPRERAALVLLAGLLARAGQDRPALPLLNRALAMEPNQRPSKGDLAARSESPPSLKVRAWLLGRKVRAELEKTDGDWGAAMVYLRHGEPQRAADCVQVYLERTLERCRTALGAADEGERQWEEGRLEDAAKKFRESIRIWPAAPWTHRSLGLTELACGRADVAVIHLTTAIGLAPTYVAARLDLALALARAGRPAAARAELANLLRYRPHDPVARHYFHRLERRFPSNPNSEARTSP